MTNAWIIMLLVVIILVGGIVFVIWLRRTKHKYNSFNVGTSMKYNDSLQKTVNPIIDSEQPQIEDSVNPINDLVNPQIEDVDISVEKDIDTPVKSETTLIGAFCYKCGKAVGYDMIFCPNCGSETIYNKGIKTKRQALKTPNELLGVASKWLYDFRKQISIVLYAMLLISMFFNFVSFGKGTENFYFNFSGFKLIISLFKENLLVYLFRDSYGNVLVDAQGNMATWVSIASFMYVIYLIASINTFSLIIRSFVKKNKKPIRTNQSVFIGSIVVLIATIVLIVAYFEIQNCLANEAGVNVEYLNQTDFGFSGSWIFLLIWSIIMVSMTAIFRFNPQNTETITGKQYFAENKKKLYAITGIILIAVIATVAGIGIYNNAMDEKRERELAAYMATPFYAADQIVKSLNEGNLQETFKYINLSPASTMGSEQVAQALVFIEKVKTYKEIQIISKEEMYTTDNIAAYECSIYYEYISGLSVTKTVFLTFEKSYSYLELIEETLWREDEYRGYYIGGLTGGNSADGEWRVNYSDFMF